MVLRNRFIRKKIVRMTKKRKIKEIRSVPKKKRKLRRKQWKKDKKKEAKRVKRDSKKQIPHVSFYGSFYKRHTKPIKAIHIERMGRFRYKRLELFILLMKLIINTKYIEKQFKAYAAMFLSSLTRHVSITRHNNICLDTGYRKSVQVFTRMNRLAMREKINLGKLSGISVAKW